MAQAYPVIIAFGRHPECLGEKAFELAVEQPISRAIVVTGSVVSIWRSIRVTALRTVRGVACGLPAVPRCFSSEDLIREW